MSLSRWAKMKTAGWEVVVKVGAFYVPYETSFGVLLRASDAAVKKYCQHYEKLGWTLESKPKVTQVPVSDEVTEVEIRPASGGATLLVPKQAPGTMPSASPFNRPGMCRYVVRAVWTHPPIHVKVDVPDEKLKRWQEEGTMPAGLRIL